MRTRRHPPPADLVLVSVPDVGRAMGLTSKGASKLLQRHWYVTRHFRRGTRYDRRVIDVLQALEGQNARPLGYGEMDWLDQFTSGGDTA